MGTPTVADILNSETFKQVLDGSPFADKSERIRSTLREIHHQFMEQRLTAQRSGPDVDISLLEATAYYLSGVAITPGRSEGISPALRSQMLAVAALIFEYLGDATGYPDENSQLEEGDLYYLDACICSTLCLFEANSVAISRKHLLWQDAAGQLTNDVTARLGLRDCLQIIYGWLARDISAIWIQRRKIEAAVENTLTDLTAALEGIKISRYDYGEMRFWLAIVQAIVSHARFFQFGGDKYLQSAAEFFSQAIEQSQNLNNPPLVWTAVALQKCSNSMSTNSIWSQLSDVCPGKYLRRLVTSSPPVLELWTSQIAAIEAKLESEGHDESLRLNKGFLDSRIRRVAISMPTSAGKTLLAELAIIKTLFPDHGQVKPAPNTTCVYVVPGLALANQVEAKLSTRLLPLGIRATAIIGGYDAAFLDDALLQRTRIAVVTPEKLDMLVRQDHPFIQQCKLFVFDEVHKLDNVGRGFTLEVLITWLKDFHPDTQKAKMIFISAAMPNILQIKAWIQPLDQTTSNLPALAISENWQPTRQIKAIFEVDKNDLIEKIEYEKPPLEEYWYGGHLAYVNDRNDLSRPRQIRRLIKVKEVYRKVTRRKTGIQEPERVSKKSFGIEAIAAELAKKYADAKFDPVLVFFMSRDQTRTFCNYLSQDGYSPKDYDQAGNLQYREIIEYIRERLGSGHPLSGYLTKGIAYHHGWLPKDVRSEIEYAYSKGWIRILACTTTLIDGVNFPISTFILANYEAVVGSQNLKPLTRQLEKKDFQNMIGRAGRAVFDTEGQIIFMIPPKPISHDFSARDYLFSLPDDPQRWILSSLSRQDFNAKILQEMLSAMENPDGASLTLAVDPDVLQTTYGPGSREVGETILRLQAFLLSLMDRETLEPNNIDTVIRFFNRTLFGQQRQNTEIFNLLTRFAATTSKVIAIAEPDKSRRSTYSKIGLGFSSCQALYNYADEFWRAYGRSYFQTNVEHLTAENIARLGDFALSLPEVRPDSVKIPHKNRANLILVPHGRVLGDWIIQQTPLEDIRNQYFAEIRDQGEKAEACANYLRDAFEYKAPWVLSAFNIFIAKIAQAETDDFNNSPLARQLSMLPAYAKFGVNTPAAAFFSMIGISAREMAIRVADHYNDDNPSGKFNFARMLEWILDLDPEQVAEWFQTDSGEDRAGYVPRLFRILDSIRSREQTLDDVSPVEIEIAGWKYYRGPAMISRLRVGDKLDLKPDALNPWDSYAVEVFDQNSNKLGFVPRSHSRAVYNHLLSELPLNCRILSIDEAVETKPVKMSLETPES